MPDTDLLGDPLAYPDTPPGEQARILYAAGDAAAAGSPERAEAYRQAAEAQRQHEAVAQRRQAEQVRRDRQRTALTNPGKRNA